MKQAEPRSAPIIPEAQVRTEATPDAERNRLARRDNDGWSSPCSGDRTAGRGRSVVVCPWRAIRRKDCLRSPAVRSRRRFFILADVWRSDDSLIYIVGDWKPPL